MVIFAGIAKNYLSESDAAAFALSINGGVKVVSVSYTAKWEVYTVANTLLGRAKDACESSKYAEERG